MPRNEQRGLAGPKELVLVFLSDNGDSAGSVKRAREDIKQSRHNRQHQAKLPIVSFLRLLSDAIRGDPSLFARMDSAEAAWRIVDPILENLTQIYEYEPNTWGPVEANRIIGDDRGWHNPMPAEGSDERSCLSL